MHHVSATNLMEICLFSSCFLTFYVDEAARSKSFSDASSTSGGACSTSIMEVHSLVLSSSSSCSASFFPSADAFTTSFLVLNMIEQLAFKNNFYSLFMYFIDFIATDLKTIPGVLEIFDDKLSLMFFVHFEEFSRGLVSRRK